MAAMDEPSHSRLKLWTICTSGRLHLRKLCHKHQVLLFQLDKMASLGMIRQKRLMVLRNR
ncbi:hypothetical protein E1A91_A05G234700v1 [Gossypium mustelinum]|uniref:Uncharacterized protein n=1 Tax=Gossypium mustelinum TaxID=34275 RepID=A0A5D2ZBQ3_GOSMU|nr:hypothetical protein E1A91_A05G234700v1 [Gossypium mustelinum]